MWDAGQISGAYQVSTSTGMLLVQDFLPQLEETAATVTGAIVVQPPDRRKGSTPNKWKQFGMPDFSQHAVSEWAC